MRHVHHVSGAGNGEINFCSRERNDAIIDAVNSIDGAGQVICKFKVVDVSGAPAGEGNIGVAKQIHEQFALSAVGSAGDAHQKRGEF